MPQLDEVMISCGIMQLHELCRDSDRFDPKDRIPPKDVLIEAFGDISWDYSPIKLTDLPFGIVLFSDSIRRGNGKRLAAFIKKEKLGKIVASDVVNNPNTRRNIQMWTWYLDRPALVKWLNTNILRQRDANGYYIPVHEAAEDIW